MSALELLKNAFEASLSPTPTVFAIGLAIVLLFPIILHFIVTSTTPYTTLPSVLLVGPSGAGKTALLTLFERAPLLASQPPASDSPSEKRPSPSAFSAAQTHTSQTPCSVELAVNADSPTASSYRDNLDAAGASAKKFLLIDTPGHAKLRDIALSRLSSLSGTTKSTPKTSSAGNPDVQSKIKSVVFMVDAAALADGDALPSTAAYLYDVLLALQKRMGSAKGSKAPHSIPVLIAANKLDLFTALPATLVKSQLEAELGRIRKTRSKGLLDSGVATDDDVAAEEQDDWLGEYGSDKFSFKQLMEFDIEVDVVGGNVTGDGPGADKWWRWIAERV